MIAVSRWLSTRKPRPPGDLAEACAVVDRHVGARETIASVLRAAAAARLSRALARPGRVRESAFELLLADALVTYACEAALEDDDVESALGHLVGIDVDVLVRPGQIPASEAPRGDASEAGPVPGASG